MSSVGSRRYERVFLVFSVVVTTVAIAAMLAGSWVGGRSATRHHHATTEFRHDTPAPAGAPVGGSAGASAGTQGAVSEWFDVVGPHAGHDTANRGDDGTLVDASGRALERYTRHVFCNGDAHDAVHDDQFSVDIGMHNVVGVELLRAWIPRGEYTINEFNQCLDIATYDVSTGSWLDARTHHLRMTTGDGWDVRSLLCEIQRMVRSADAHECSPRLGNFTVAVHPRKTRVIMSNAEFPFKVLFRSGPNHLRGMSDILGFTGGDAVSEAAPAHPVAACACEGQCVCRPTFATVAEGRVDLSGARFLDVKTSELHVEHTGGILAQIAMEPSLPIVQYNPFDVCGNMRVFRRPRHIPVLTVSFDVVEPRRVRAGAPTNDSRPYNFNGLRWNMTLVVHALRWKIPWVANVDVSV